MLHVIDSLVPGGAETSLASMAEHFDALDIDLHVAFFLDRPGLQDRFRSAGADLHHVDAARRRRVGELRRLIGELDAAVVHTSLFEADQAGRLAGWLSRRPVISSFVSTGFELGTPWSISGIKARGAVAVDAVTVRAASRLHAVSLPVAAFMANRLRLPIEDFTVIPRGRDPEDLGVTSPQRRAHVREQLGLGERPMVLVVGRQVAPKGHLTLIEALPALIARVPDVVVVFAGQRGDTTESVEQLASTLGVERSLLRLGHRSDVADLLAAADVLAHPSAREGFPGTLVEALALECPIVASDLPSIRSVVDCDGEVLADLTPVGDPRSLCDALADVLSNGRNGRRMTLGRAHFEERFTTATVAAEFRRMYDGVLAPDAPNHRTAQGDRDGLRR